MKKGNPWALLPIVLFAVLYMGLGILFEYVMHIPMGFYNVPVVVIFLVALAIAFLQDREHSFEEKMTIMGRGVGRKDILTMVLIFLEAGIFVGVVGDSSAASVAHFMLSFIPGQYAVAALFLIAALVSLAMGTSVGTISMLTPMAVSLSAASGFSLELCVGTVIGGAMFGDNLSFISDTTIAACNGQGCPMGDKFRENFAIALPAALLTLCIILLRALGEEAAPPVTGQYNLLQALPYLLVLLGGVMGVSVFAVLLLGIVSGAVIMLYTGEVTFVGLVESMGHGAAGMFETVMVAILVAAIGGMIRENGGFEVLLGWVRRNARGKKGSQLGIGLLVGAMDVATANNTVAIVMANPIAWDVAREYGITPSKTASLLDTFSCVFQGLLPYGAQMLVAISAASGLGHILSPFKVISHMYYPVLLLISCLVFIFILPDRPLKGKKKHAVNA